MFYEYAPKKFLRNGTFLPKEQLRNKTGYRTLYGFGEEILTHKSSAGLDKFVPCASQLIIDLDDGNESLQELIDALEERELGYRVWFSGNKGYHVYITHQFVASHDLPYSHAEFVKSLGLPKFDNIYQHGRLIRLPHTVHETTGKTKHLVKEVYGNDLVLPIVTKPIEETFKAPVTDSAYFVIALRRATKLAENEPQRELRHTNLWGLATDCIRCGLSPETTYELVSHVNDRWKEKKSEQKLRDIIKQARHYVK